MWSVQKFGPKIYFPLLTKYKNGRNGDAFKFKETINNIVLFMPTELINRLSGDLFWSGDLDSVHSPVDAGRYGFNSGGSLLFMSTELLL